MLCSANNSAVKRLIVFWGKQRLFDNPNSTINTLEILKTKAEERTMNKQQDRYQLHFTKRLRFPRCCVTIWRSVTNRYFGPVKFPEYPIYKRLFIIWIEQQKGYGSREDIVVWWRYDDGKMQPYFPTGFFFSRIHLINLNKCDILQKKERCMGYEH